jgi:Ca-activated chloride channel family protein
VTLQHPEFILIAVLAGVAAAFVYALALRRRTAQTLRYSNLAFLVAAVNARTWPAKVLGAACACAAALLVFAFAGPHVRAAVPVAGSVVLCVDTSGSMTATDVEPTRADAAVAALRAFVNAAPAGTAVGIVSFATGAQVLLPPTRDRDQIRAAVDDIPAPNGATAIGDALIAAERVLPKSGHRVVVLITDGENNYGADPMAAAHDLAKNYIPLYTIGIGTNTGALIPGTLQAAGINEDALRAYAAATGGAYSRADNAVQLRSALARLGRITAFERRTVDVSLPVAEAGAALMVLAFLGGLAAGRYP